MERAANDTIGSAASKPASAFGLALTSLLVAASVFGSHSPSPSVAAAGGLRGDVATASGPGRRRAILEWADVLEVAPDPKLVSDDDVVARIRATGLPWRVRHRKSGIEMLLIPSGVYTRGASAKDSNSEPGEEPRHEVTITKAFYLGRSEVTQGQWTRVMERNPSHFDGGDDLPVERVSWNDICDSKGFIARSGGDLRLPTEGEWEYACRAGGRTIYSGGNTRDRLLESGWFFQNSGRERFSDYYIVSRYSMWPNFAELLIKADCKTHAVGQKEVSAWGLCDMHGNVAEWCSDWLSGYSTCSGGATDPTGAPDGTYRVVRGGAWNDFAEDCSSSRRGGRGPDARDFNIGFRVARTP